MSTAWGGHSAGQAGYWVGWGRGGDGARAGLCGIGMWKEVGWGRGGAGTSWVVWDRDVERGGGGRGGAGTSWVVWDRDVERGGVGQRWGGHKLGCVG